MISEGLIAGTLKQRAIFSPRHLLWAILAIYGLLEFFPVSYGLSTVSFFAVAAFCLAWLLAFPKTTLINKTNFEVLIFFGFWLAYTLLGYIWAADRDLALKHALLVFRYMGVFLIFNGFFRDRRILNKAHLAMAAVLILYILVAFWEMLTFQHLPTSRYYGLDFYFLPTGPFYNQNNLAAFMLFIMPFLLFLPKLYKKPWLKPAVLFVTVLILVVFTVQGARIAMLAAAVMLLLIGLAHSSFFTKLAVALLLVLAVWGFFRFAPPAMQMGWKLAQREISSFGSEADSAHMSSLKIRAQLVHETTDLAVLSGFMGLGGGNYEHYMATDRQYRTAGITNAHNWFLEILGNFGILILAGFVYIYLRWLWLLFDKYKHSEGRERWLYLSYLWALLMFIPVSALPSSIRWNHHIWIIFAAINAICHSDKPLFKER